MRSEQGFAEIVKHGETVKLFLGNVGPDEVESFCNQEIPRPQVGRLFRAILRRCWRLAEGSFLFYKANTCN